MGEMPHSSYREVPPSPFTTVAAEPPTHLYKQQRCAAGDEAYPMG
jgi:hypothetical protein